MVAESSQPAFKKGRWAPKRPTDSISAQMSAPYAAASRIVDRAVLVGQFALVSLDRDEVWKWVDKNECAHNPEFDKDKKTMWFQRMTVKFTDARREKMEVFVRAERGEAIVNK